MKDLYVKYVRKQKIFDACDKIGPIIALHDYQKFRLIVLLLLEKS
ncbi:MAG: hypothetical protein OEY17_07015 [Nitrosopumilus sp.]|nr:hypothetical protein [Nitrosopumilus sp.]MDH5659075.1 hypothetical protein [Nitrosopumilus sp.]